MGEEWDGQDIAGKHPYIEIWLMLYPAVYNSWQFFAAATTNTTTEEVESKDGILESITHN